MNSLRKAEQLPYGKLSRDLRKAEPLTAESSAVTPAESSAVSHGSAFRVRSYSISFINLQKFLQAVLHVDQHASRSLTRLTSDCCACVLQRQVKTYLSVRP